MKITTTLAAAIGLAALAACGGREENIAENVDANLVTENLEVPTDNMANVDMNVGNDMNNVTDNVDNAVDNATNNVTNNTTY